MKRIVFLTTLSFILFTISKAQNVGIGTTAPMNKLQVNGNLLVTGAEIATSTLPTAAQKITMVNGSTINTSPSDSTGIIYSPGAPLSNYLPNLTAAVIITSNSNTAIGIQIQFNGMNLSTGDTMTITDDYGAVLLRVGNNYNTQGTYVFSTTEVAIYFKSNADAFVGRGFVITYKHIYADKTTPAVSGFAGNSLFFNTETGAFVAGTPNNSPIGFNSVELGFNNIASAQTAVAMGQYTTASGIGATAMGDRTTASGYSSTAMGEYAVASGDYSLATGYNTNANGLYSVAMGYDVSTGNNDGVFILGDSQSGDVSGPTVATVPDQFVARFNNGYYLLSTNSYPLVGVVLAHGGNSWSAISDSAKKEKMVPVNGEDFLNKVAAFKLSSWNYKGQDAKTFRHYGPMAQDFYNAFGKDAFGTIGCDTLINQQDFLGVNFIAIQALEKRTEKIEQLQKQNSVQQQQLEQLQQNNLALQQQLKELVGTVTALNKKVEVLASANHANQNNTTIAVKGVSN